MSLFSALQTMFEGRSFAFREDYCGSSEVDLGGSNGGVTARRVAGYPAVSQALQMISGDCAKLPLQVVKVVADGVEWKERIGWSKILAGLRKSMPRVGAA